jgi:hypothetical protein
MSSEVIRVVLNDVGSDFVNELSDVFTRRLHALRVEQAKHGNSTYNYQLEIDVLEKQILKMDRHLTK